MRRSVSRAAALFARLEPELAASLFDEPFLGRFEPTTLLSMEPRELAIEWTRQFSYADQRRRDRDVTAMTGAADGFLEQLRRVMLDDDAVPALPSVRRRGATLTP